MGQIVAITSLPYNGFLGATPTKRINKYMVIEDKVHTIHDAVVHSFMLGDVDDPDIYAAAPLIEWQNSESGAWVMKHAMETPMWHRQADPMGWGFRISVTAKLKAKDYSYFLLKWGEKGTQAK